MDRGSMYHMYRPAKEFIIEFDYTAQLAEGVGKREDRYDGRLYKDCLKEYDVDVGIVFSNDC